MEMEIKAAEPAKVKADKDITEEAFKTAITEAGEKKEEPKEKIETEFENFLKMFPEDDPTPAIRGAIKNGDFRPGCLTRQYVLALKAEIEELKEENNSEEAVLKKALASGKVTESVVKEYLKAVAEEQRTLRKSAVGSSPAMPPSKPKTIMEAGALAGDIFKNKNQ